MVVGSGAPHLPQESSGRPSSGVDAWAWVRSGMRPARRASQPASTARRIALAIFVGSSAPKIELATRMASQPSSIASAASDAVPIPASSTTGTPARSTMIAMLYGLRIPGAGSDRRAERHHRGAPHVLQPAGEDRVVVRVGKDGEAVGDQRFGGVEQLDRVRVERAVVADHLQLDPIGVEGLPSELCGANGVAGGEAAGGVGQRKEAEPLDTSSTEPWPRGRRAEGRRSRSRCRRPTAPPPSAPSERKPPVPAINREVHCLPPSSQVSSPPWIAASTSTLRPWLSGVAPHCARGTTSPSSATATPRASLVGAALPHGVLQGGAVRQVARLAVELDPHRATSAAPLRSRSGLARGNRVRKLTGLQQLGDRVRGQRRQ